MITYMDTEIGMLLDKLREKGLEDNTIIFFSSDNGPHHEGGVKPEFFDSSGPMKGVKRDLYEGGIRMPTIVRWPSKINGGQVSDAPWAFWDFLPTAAELAGGSAKGKLDGRSIVPLLLGKSKSVHDYFYWELEDHSSLSSYRGFQQAVLMGKWKAVHRGNGTELYDLSKDIGEANNIAAENPKIVAKAEELFKSARTEHKYPAGKSKHKSPKSNSKATTSPGGQANGNVETTATR
jgi:arylsulfatase A-like enzyme